MACKTNALKEFACTDGCRSTFVSKIVLYVKFAMFPAQRLLAEKSSILVCHATSKQLTKAHAVGEKFSLIQL